MAHCKICGEWDCSEHETTFIGKTWKKELKGSTPPEIFVGRWNYPNVYAGIVTPEEQGDTSRFSSPEEWHKQQLSIRQITDLRHQLVYGRTRQHIKQVQSPFMSILKEVAMTHKSIATELTFKKPIQQHNEHDATTPLLVKTALIERAQLQENAPVKSKVDSLVNDNVKAATGIVELANASISSETITKLLSAGLLGNKMQRRLVPTRWSITAVDDIISKKNLEKIRDFPVLSEYRIFNATYLGNHYEFILLPHTYAFEVIELSVNSKKMWQDYESITPRKKYAESVTGAYYANRLALTEYLLKIKRQAACLVLREIRPEYNAPCGVGILRQVSREAFISQSTSTQTFGEAKKHIQERLQMPLEEFTKHSWLLTQPQQRQLHSFFT